MNHRLACADIARVEAALQLALIDARDLLGERGHARLFVVQPRQAQDAVWDAPVLVTDNALGVGFGFRVGPARFDRLVLIDRLAGAAGAMDEHGAGVEELLDVERL